ncbi:ATP synthase F1 subunit gamma [Hippea maritima]|uniref:ATP synthase gamma chain n=1 Tax=Hippea maritima (strain ATCC 700847 / DSM 10411 / MH2) TaxID=760142 RepID=F2LW27_HIPMA|nr:ATP synthase F1 subunit gamma [Hippea maritima]AEA33961.1 ATP synthase gamma chain [Hippea maritima DSM 10411]
MAVSMRDIKRKITSIQKTQQITKAMKMVAAAKLRKTQEAALMFRPYRNKLEQMIGALVSSSSHLDNKLLRFRDVKNVDLIVITSDRGLCGAFNHNVLKETERLINTKFAGKNVNLILIGRFAHTYFKFRGIRPKEAYSDILKDKAEFSVASDIMDKIIVDFSDEKSDEVYVVYNRFVNVLVQKVTVKKVLPVYIGDKVPTSGQVEEKFLFEPNKETVLNELLPKYVKMELYGSMLESLAGEYAARMTAMDAATNNAGEMIKSLTLEFNKARQASITKELIEITTSIEAMKQ